MRIGEKGQITIPQEIRERAGLLPDTEIELVVEGNSVRIVKVEVAEAESRGAAAVRLLRGKARTPMTADEILALTRGDE